MKTIVHVLEEHYCSSRDATLNTHFHKLGLTDSALFNIAPKLLVVTADFLLYSLLRANHVDAVNFNHLRPLSWK